MPAEFAALPTLDDLDLKVFDFAALLPEPLSDEDEEARTNAAALELAAIHIARPLGLDPATTPILDARLGDGSHVAICVPPASPSVAITVLRQTLQNCPDKSLVSSHSKMLLIGGVVEVGIHSGL